MHTVRSCHDNSRHTVTTHEAGTGVHECLPRAPICEHTRHRQRLLACGHGPP